MVAGGLYSRGVAAPVPTRQPRRACAAALLCAVVVLHGCGGGGRVSAATLVAAGCTGGSTTGVLFANAEVEPMLARAPANADHLVAAWQQDRWSDGGARAIVSAVSFDGGGTWSRALHPMSRCGGAAAGSSGDFERTSDPWVDIGADGTVHVMALALSGQSFTGSGRSAMLASRSTDGGRSYSAPQALVDNAGAGFFNDKNTLTVDALEPRYVYAVWDRLEATGNGPTLLARSTDAGASWEPVREIYRPPAAAGGTAQTIGNRIVVLAGGPARGVLVNAFVQIDVVGGSSRNSVRVIRSSDHGTTWSAAVTVADHRGVGTADPATGVAIRDGGIIPGIAAAPDGTLWLAWQDSRFSGGQRDAIVVSRSQDGGLTWSPPAAASRNLGVGAFTPTLHVRADGLLGLLYFDLRPDTPATGTLLAAAWLVTTRDGSSWNEATVWNPFDLTQAPNARGLFLGDYMGLVSAGSEFVPLLALSATDPDNRTDIYALRLPPATAAALAPTSAERSRVLRGAVSEAEFMARRQAFTRAVMERRVPDWGRRVGLVEVAGRPR
jgi:hypothetical protein